MSFLLVPWVLWWTAWRRRWGVWKGFGLAMVMLVGVSLLLVPTWLMDFVEGVRNYDVVAGILSCHSLTWIVVRDFLGLGPVAEAAGVAVFALYGLLEAWRGRRVGWSGFLWTTGLLLILTHFIAPRTATTHYMTLLLPLFSWFALIGKRLGRRAGLVVAGIEAALLVGQWAIFLTTIQGNYETGLVYLPFPVLMLAVQVLTCRSRSEGEP
jgi:hypothetical protein